MKSGAIWARMTKPTMKVTANAAMATAVQINAFHPFLLFFAGSVRGCFESSDST